MEEDTMEEDGGSPGSLPDTDLAGDDASQQRPSTRGQGRGKGRKGKRSDFISAKSDKRYLRIAHGCWERAQVAPGTRLTDAMVCAFLKARAQEGNLTPKDKGKRLEWTQMEYMLKALRSVAVREQKQTEEEVDEWTQCSNFLKGYGRTLADAKREGFEDYGVAQFVDAHNLGTHIKMLKYFGDRATAPKRGALTVTETCFVAMRTMAMCALTFVMMLRPQVVLRLTFGAMLQHTRPASLLNRSKQDMWYLIFITDKDKNNSKSKIRFSGCTPAKLIEYDACWIFAAYLFTLEHYKKLGGLPPSWMGRKHWHNQLLFPSTRLEEGQWAKLSPQAMDDQVRAAKESLDVPINKCAGANRGAGVRHGEDMGASDDHLGRLGDWGQNDPMRAHYLNKGLAFPAADAIGGFPPGSDKWSARKNIAGLENKWKYAFPGHYDQSVCLEAERKVEITNGQGRKRPAQGSRRRRKKVPEQQPTSSGEESSSADELFGDIDFEENEESEGCVDREMLENHRALMELAKLLVHDAPFAKRVWPNLWLWQHPLFNDAEFKAYEAEALKQEAELAASWEEYRNVMPNQLLDALAKAHSLFLGALKEHQDAMLKDSRQQWDASFIMMREAMEAMQINVRADVHEVVGDQFSTLRKSMAQQFRAMASAWEAEPNSAPQQGASSPPPTTQSNPTASSTAPSSSAADESAAGAPAEFKWLYAKLDSLPVVIEEYRNVMNYEARMEVEQAAVSAWREGRAQGQANRKKYQRLIRAVEAVQYAKREDETLEQAAERLQGQLKAKNTSVTKWIKELTPNAAEGEA